MVKSEEKKIKEEMKLLQDNEARKLVMEKMENVVVDIDAYLLEKILNDPRKADMEKKTHSYCDLLRIKRSLCKEILDMSKTILNNDAEIRNVWDIDSLSEDIGVIK